MSDTRHGVKEVFYDNLGEGWRMECFCGFMGNPEEKLIYAGEEMDEHFEAVRDAPPATDQAAQPQPSTRR